MVPPANTEQADSVWDNVEDDLGEEIMKMSVNEIRSRTRLLDNEVRVSRNSLNLNSTHSGILRKRLS